ncbi:copper amine oxidase N-terminal domain-containing protein [Niallia oryzisoli]|uniref:Copper amine oxidase N-terminal domain-containing protein n=1 Tax=Niallia oryzisoli TaxID=1737571 RepID=A0ABZ2CDY8_9BACI
MKSKITKWMLAFFMLFFIFQTGTIANADDDDEGVRYERHEHEDEDREYEEDDDEGYYEENTTNYGDGTMYESTPVQSTFWNLWTREISSTTSNTELPFQEAKEVSIELNNTSESFFMIPQNGQLLVPGEKVAKFLGAKSRYYQQSKILELSKGTEELIVRAGTNAAYENMVKTPMPTQSFYYERSVYLPISVISNALGYRVNWDAAKLAIILQEI